MSQETDGDSTIGAILRKLWPGRSALTGTTVGSVITALATYLCTETGIIGGKTYPPVPQSGEAVALATWGRLTPEIACREQARVGKVLNDYFNSLAEANANGKQNPSFVITEEECRAIVEKRAQKPG